jgi:hypothetical protein
LSLDISSTLRRSVVIITQDSKTETHGTPKHVTIKKGGRCKKAINKKANQRHIFAG